jgi:hypothetical protein
MPTRSAFCILPSTPVRYPARAASMRAGRRHGRPREHARIPYRSAFRQLTCTNALSAAGYR